MSIKTHSGIPRSIWESPFIRDTLGTTMSLESWRKPDESGVGHSSQSLSGNPCSSARPPFGVPSQRISQLPSTSNPSLAVRSPLRRDYGRVRNAVCRLATCPLLRRTFSGIRGQIRPAELLVRFTVGYLGTTFTPAPLICRRVHSHWRGTSASNRCTENKIPDAYVDDNVTVDRRKHPITHPLLTPRREHKLTLKAIQVI